MGEDQPALCQIALSVMDLELTARWFEQGLGFIPSGGTRLLMSMPFSGNAQGLPGARSTCWFMIGQNPRAQLEMFQFTRPLGRRLPDDFRPCDIGYTRMGVHLLDFDGTLERLRRLGTVPTGPVSGDPGERRACVRSPDGVFIELMEADPLPDAPRTDVASKATLRSVTLSTPDLDASVRYLEAIIGTPPSDVRLHCDEHEALWGLAGARCRRAVFVSGDMLLEVAEYERPAGRPSPRDYRLSDIGILNIGIGLSSRAGHRRVYERALAFGARANRKPLDFGVCGLVYFNDSLGFSVEVLWAKPGLDFGYTPAQITKSSYPCAQEVVASVFLSADVADVRRRLSENGSGRLRDAIARLAGDADVDLAPADDGFCYRAARSHRFGYHLGKIELYADGIGTRLQWHMRFRNRSPIRLKINEKEIELELRRTLI